MCSTRQQDQSVTSLHVVIRSQLAPVEALQDVSHFASVRSARAQLNREVGAVFNQLQHHTRGEIMSDDEDTTEYTVLVNGEEQYSLWPERKAIPAGWRAAGKRGSKDECSKFVDEVWVDMRPLSLRKAMDVERPAGAAE
jgi:MbtH protein